MLVFYNVNLKRMLKQKGKIYQLIVRRTQTRQELEFCMQLRWNLKTTTLQIHSSQSRLRQIHQPNCSINKAIFQHQAIFNMLPQLDQLIMTICNNFPLITAYYIFAKRFIVGIRQNFEGFWEFCEIFLSSSSLLILLRRSRWWKLKRKWVK